MSNGQWYPSTSDYALGLSGNTRLYPFGHYDSSGAYIGANNEATGEHTSDYDSFGDAIDALGDQLGL